MNALLVLLLSLWAGYPGSQSDHSRVIDPASNIYRIKSQIYKEVVEFKTNPVATLFYDLNYRLTSSPMMLKGRLPFHIERKPQIKLESYLRSIDAGSLKKRNVILLLVESLRPDQLLSFGGERLVMKNIEALSNKSLRFSRAYTQASHSSYADLCPLSSHYPLRSKAIHFYPEDPPYPKVLIYDVLKMLGYRTAIFSSQNEKWGQMYNYLQSKHLDTFFHSETYDGETYTPTNDTVFAQMVKGTKLSGKIDDRFTVEEAVKWIDKDENSPFFIYMNLQNSHVPFPVPADFERKIWSGGH